MPSICSINVDARRDALVTACKYIEQKQPDIVAIQDLPSMNTDSALCSFINNITPSFEFIPSGITVNSAFILPTSDSLYIADKNFCRSKRTAKNYNILLFNKKTAKHIEMYVNRYCKESDDDDEEEEDEESNSTEGPKQFVSKLLFRGERAYALTAAFKVSLKTEQLFYITSIYIRPTAEPQEVSKLVRHLNGVFKRLGKSRQILLGDMNTQTVFWTPMDKLERQLCLTKKTNWNYKFESINDHYERGQKRARTLTRFIETNKLVAMNDTQQGPTYINPYQDHASYIDCILMGNRAVRFFSDFKVQDLDFSMRHKLISVESKFSLNREPQQQRYKTIRTFNWHKIEPTALIDLKNEIDLCIMTPNWKDLPRETNIKKLELITIKLQQCLFNIQEKITTERKMPVRMQASNFNIEEQIKLREKSKHKWMPKFKKIVNSVRKEKKVNALELEMIWREVKEVRNLVTSTTTNANENMANQDNPNFEKKLNEILMKNFPYSCREKANRLIEPLLSKSSLYSTEINESELDVVLNEMLGKKTYVGADGIYFKTLEHTIEHIKSILLTIVRLSFYTGHNPRSLMTLKGKLIAKKTPGKYRIVHISSPIMAIIERVAFHRIVHIIESKQLMSANQYGFVPRRGRFEFVARILELIFKHKMIQLQRNTSNDSDITIASLDIDGAFDNVDQNLLIEKTCKLFGQKETIVAWLADFILKRKIVIHWNNKETSEEALVCRGVPQGSSLGPVLWNLMINDLDKCLQTASNFCSTPNSSYYQQQDQADLFFDDIFSSQMRLQTKMNRKELACLTKHPTSLFKTEMLCYADDIVLVHLGNDIQMLQDNLNNVSNELKKMHLKLSFEKSIFMRIRMNRLTRRNIIANVWPDFFELSVNNMPITQVSTMNILGVPITDTLSLETNNESLESKIFDNARTLKILKQLRVVKGAKVWQILFASYIQSLIIDKNLPILAVSRKSIEWADEAMIKVARFVFDWPSATSVKLIRLFLNINTTDQLIEKFFIGKLTAGCEQSLSHSFKLLENVYLNGHDFYSDRFLKISKIVPDLYKSRPRYSIAQALISPQQTCINRTKQIVSTTTATVTNLILLETAEKTFIVEYLQDARNGQELIYNFKAYEHVINRQNNSYFNSLAALKHFTDKRSCNETHNKIEIIMSFKCSLYQAISNCSNHDWRIVKLRNALYLKKCKLLALEHDDYLCLKKKLIKRLPNNASSITSTWPVVWDYIARYDKYSKYNEKLRLQLTNMNLTGLTKALTLTESDSIEHWQSISPSNISSLDLLSLAGMIQHQERNKLVYGKLTIGQILECCNLCVFESSEQYITLHRIFECTKVSAKLQSQIDSFKTVLQKTPSIIATLNANQQPIADANVEFKSLFKQSLRHKKVKYLALRLLRCAANLDGSMQLDNNSIDLEEILEKNVDLIEAAQTNNIIETNDLMEGNDESSTIINSDVIDDMSTELDFFKNNGSLNNISNLASSNTYLDNDDENFCIDWDSDISITELLDNSYNKTIEIADDTPTSLYLTDNELTSFDADDDDIYLYDYENENC